MLILNPNFLRLSHGDKLCEAIRKASHKIPALVPIEFSCFDKSNLVVNLGQLLSETTYYWRVDTFATVTPNYIDGLVWNFTTRPPICQGVLAGDFNDDCKVTFVDFALLAANWRLCNLPDPLDCD